MVKKKEFRFTFKVFLRLFIFSLIIYFSIKWFSSQKPPILGAVDITLSKEESKNNFLSDLYLKLPENSRYQLEHLNENKTIILIQDQLNGFPSKQIKEIQKAVIKNVSDSMIKNIDED